MNKIINTEMEPTVKHNLDKSEKSVYNLRHVLAEYMCEQMILLYVLKLCGEKEREKRDRERGIERKEKLESIAPCDKQKEYVLEKRGEYLKEN